MFINQYRQFYLLFFYDLFNTLFSVMGDSIALFQMFFQYENLTFKFFLMFFQYENLTFKLGYLLERFLNSINPIDLLSLILEWYFHSWNDLLSQEELLSPLMDFTQSHYIYIIDTHFLLIFNLLYYLYLLFWNNSFFFI